MNESEVLLDSSGQYSIVYTDPNHDPLSNGVSRAIPLGTDVFYPGTCESDIICYFAVDNTSSAEAEPCTEGYICDQETSSDVEV